MALTPLERKRRQLARQREALGLAPDQAASYLRRTFPEYLAKRILELDENLDSLGVAIKGSSILHDEEQSFESEGLGRVRMTALERAEGLAGVFLDAAQELHNLINRYKLEEIESAIEDAVAGMARLPRDDVDALKGAFAEIEKLKAIRMQLRKTTRRNLPAITAKEAI
jgi:hypothetical protein